MGLRAGIAGSPSRLTPGAGRILDLFWPAKLGYIVEGQALGFPTSLGREGLTPGADNASSQQILADGYAIYRQNLGGMPFILLSAVTPGLGRGVSQNLDNLTMQANLGLAADVGYLEGVDDFRCWRSLAVLRFGPQTGYGDDCGIQWTTAVNPGGSGILRNVVRGFGFSMTAADTISFIWFDGAAPHSVIARKTSAADLQNIWHSYEVRLIGATATASAILKVLVDGIVIKVLDWALDPMPYPSDGAVVGFKTSLHSMNGGELRIALPPRVRMMAAPTEEALL